MWSIPLLAEEGRLRHQLKFAKPPKAPQTGAKRERDSAKHKIVVSSAKAFRPNDFAGLTTPSARTKVASRYFLTAHPPLLFKEGKMLARQFIHTFYDRPYNAFVTTKDILPNPASARRR